MRNGLELERPQVQDENNVETACLQWGLTRTDSEPAHTPCTVTASTTAPPSAAHHNFDRRTRHSLCGLCSLDLLVRSKNQREARRIFVSPQLPSASAEAGECYRRLIPLRQHHYGPSGLASAIISNALYLSAVASSTEGLIAPPHASAGSLTIRVTLNGTNKGPQPLHFSRATGHVQSHSAVLGSFED